MALNHLCVSAYPLRMSGIFRSLALGLALIAATSALLLLSDLRSRVKPAVTESVSAPVRKMRVAILQHTSIKNLDDGRDGALAGMAEQGWREGENLEIQRFNAEGDMAVAQTIAKAMVGGQYDLLLTITTTSLQAVANANKETKIPHVFGLVTDPYAAGVGINRDNHLDHPAHLAGYGTMQPVELAFKIARRMNPALSKVGVIWNAAETNSEAQVKLARKVCAELKIELLESTVENSAGVGEAAAALVSRGVDAIWQGGDVTVITAIETVLSAARKGRIPVFSVVPSNIKRGMLFDVGADYFEVGRIVGELAGEVLHGRSPASVSVDNRMPETLCVNVQATLGLRDKWTVPDDLLPKAVSYIDAQGVEHNKATPKVIATHPSAATPAKPAAPATLPRVAVVQQNTQPILDAGTQGMIDGLAEAGFRDGETLAVRRFNPMGDSNLANAIAVEVSQGGYDLILTATTPSLQSVANANRSRHTPHLFALVADPSATGVGVSATDPLDHPPYLSGYGTRLPVISAFRIAREINPALKTVGVLWNSSEVNSEVQLVDARKICAELGITLVEVNVDSTNAVAEATAALLSRDVEAVFVPGDITVLGAVNNVLERSRRAGIPVFSLFPSAQPKGELFNVGADYHEVGRQTGLLAAEVLRGLPVASIPVKNIVPERLALNEQARAQLRDAAKWNFPAALKARAGLYVDADGKLDNRTAPPTPAPKPSVTPVPAPAVPSAPVAAKTPARKFRLDVVTYIETPPMEETIAGLKEGLAKGPLLPGRDLEIRYRSAQGDMSTLSSLFDAALTDRTDLLVPLSTPSFQVAVGKTRSGSPKVVFGTVANPIAAGGGKSNEDHLAHITGITVQGPAPQMINLLRRHFPQFKRIGTLYCPAEVNSVDARDHLAKSAAAFGLTVESVAVNSPTELVDAATSLASRDIDVIVQVSDNLSNAGFTALARAARAARKPLISMNSTTIPQGAGLAMGHDYHEVGIEVANRIQRVLAGEDPAKIPFAQPDRISLVVHPANAAATGLILPEALISEASKVIRD
jgi:ABC-type uncharacterized transport system substrate-binding protein